MENKKTSELLDLIDQDPETDEDWKKFEEANAELEKRWPFSKLFGETLYSNVEDMTHEERLEALEDEVKLLKRHKHDPNSGDVMVRI